MFFWVYKFAFADTVRDEQFRAVIGFAVADADRCCHGLNKGDGCAAALQLLVESGDVCAVMCQRETEKHAKQQC